MTFEVAFYISLIVNILSVSKLTINWLHAREREATLRILGLDIDE